MMATLKLEMDREEVECVLLALGLRKSILESDAKFFEATTVARASDLARDARRQSEQVWQAYLKIARASDDALFGVQS